MFNNKLVIEAHTSVPFHAGGKHIGGCTGIIFLHEWSSFMALVFNKTVLHFFFFFCIFHEWAIDYTLKNIEDQCDKKVKKNTGK